MKPEKKSYKKEKKIEHVHREEHVTYNSVFQSAVEMKAQDYCR